MKSLKLKQPTSQTENKEKVTESNINKGKAESEVLLQENQALRDEIEALKV